MKNEKGFTLVEILASLIILFIVLITFFGFFTQSAVFTRTNQKSLDATNLANHVVEVLRSESVENIEQLRAREKLGIDGENRFVDDGNISLRVTNLDTEKKLRLTRIKIEIIQVENESILATRYFYAHE